MIGQPFGQDFIVVTNEQTSRKGGILLQRFRSWRWGFHLILLILFLAFATLLLLFLMWLFIVVVRFDTPSYSFVEEAFNGLSIDRAGLLLMLLLWVEGDHLLYCKGAVL